MPGFGAGQVARDAEADALRTEDQTETMITIVILDGIRLGLFGWCAYIGFKAAKRTGNKGYVLLALYCCLSIPWVILSRLPQVDAPIEPLPDSPLMEDALPPADAPGSADAADAPPLTPQGGATLPVLPALLAGGCYLLAKDDPREPEEADEENLYSPDSPAPEGEERPDPARS